MVTGLAVVALTFAAAFVVCGVQEWRATARQERLNRRLRGE